MAATMTGWYPALGLAAAAVFTAIVVGPGAGTSVTPGPMAPSDSAASFASDVTAAAVVVSNPEATRAGSLLSAPESAAEATPVLTESGFVVQASEAWSLTVVDGPSSTPVGAWIECSYLSIPSFDAPLESLGPVIPWAGGAFDLWCWSEPGHVAVAGYPQVVLFDPLEPVPGLVDVIDVAEFAQSQIEFEPPAMQLSPAARQIVGIETWLAVTSELDYPDVSAQAGLAWATVRTTFRDAVWDLGDGSVVSCTDDATTTWDPTAAADQQTSDCTHTYVESSADLGYPASVTVTWTLGWINNNAPDVFVPWTTLSLATPVSIAVDQLQAVIR